MFPVYPQALFPQAPLIANAVNIVSKLSTNLLYPGEIIDPASIESRIHGSKLILVLETSMIMLIWGCKACLLLLYNKLTFGLKAQWSVKIVAVYCGISLLVMEVLYFGVWCRPIQNYWAVPTPNGGFLLDSFALEMLTCARPMFDCSESSHHKCCLQHIVRRHDVVYSSAFAAEIDAATDEV